VVSIMPRRLNYYKYEIERYNIILYGFNAFKI